MRLVLWRSVSVCARSSSPNEWIRVLIASRGSHKPIPNCQFAIVFDANSSHLILTMMINWPQRIACLQQQKNVRTIHACNRKWSINEIVCFFSFFHWKGYANRPTQPSQWLFFFFQQFIQRFEANLPATKCRNTRRDGAISLCNGGISTDRSIYTHARKLVGQVASKISRAWPTSFLKWNRKRFAHTRTRYCHSAIAVATQILNALSKMLCALRLCQCPLCIHD